MTPGVVHVHRLGVQPADGTLFAARRTGREYLETQPWSEGGATDPVAISEDGQRTLMFAHPIGYHFAMRLDAPDRIVAERIVTPNHLMTRAEAAHGLSENRL